MLKAKLLGATAGAEAALAIEDVFSTYLYTGNSSTQTITNGIDLAGEGGLVWLKARSAANSHAIYDTLRGNTLRLNTNTTGAAQDTTTSLSSFNSNGFSLSGSNNQSNESPTTYASWTFRQAPRFFDVVTYTGTGANRTISHDLGIVPGCIIVKRTDTTGDWQVYHRSLANTEYLVLNSTAAKATGATRWNSTTPTSSVFSLGTDATVNASGGTYVAYLFAHDPLGPSGDGSDGLIACGSFTTDGSGKATVNLGWEPQFSILKATNVTSSWLIQDNMRGFNYGVYAELYPNSSSAELSGTPGYIAPTATGFSTVGSTNILGSSNTYIYIAIRRGPMREPTVGTEVFAPVTSTSAQNTKLTAGFPVDMQMITWRTSSVSTNTTIVDRLRGVSTNTSGGAFARLISSSTAAEDTAGVTNGWDNTGFRTSGAYASISTMYQNFCRAPGFFDAVCWTSSAAGDVVKNHNLGVVPELIIQKSRNSSDNWRVWQPSGIPNFKYLSLNLTSALTSLTDWNGSATSSTFTALSSGTSINYVAYLFATLPGISKVGTYTGNGSSQTINCGFTTGARFILIKRTDSTGDWYVWDTARGIVTGNDPHLSLNTTAAEVTTDDTIDPDNSGFIVNQVAATSVNVSSASYIFYAVS